MLEDGVSTTLLLNWVKVEEIANIQCYIYTRTTSLHKTLFTRNIAYIYVNTLFLVLNSFLTDEQMEHIANISNNYVSITGYILEDISIPRWMINSQHYMLSQPVFHNISIDT